jgi:hypothetical protein
VRASAHVAALAALAFLLAWAAPAQAHKGSPNYRATVRSVDPRIAGLDVRVLNYDDRLELINRTGRDVEVRGYGDEPYIRVLADRTVEVNKRSPSFYLNEDRFADVEVPRDASETAPPRWQVVDKTGRYEWHDHRIHYMSKNLPTQVTDKSKRTKVFDWSLPIHVGDRRARVEGDLYWVPATSGLPRGALLAFAAVLVAGICVVELARRRRRRQAKRPGGESQAWG